VVDGDDHGNLNRYGPIGAQVNRHVEIPLL